MRKVLFIFGDLSDGDIEWLAAAGERKTFPKGSVLVQEGKPIAEIYILLDGELSVTVTSAAKTVNVNTLQKGEIIGELSFLDSRPPSATVFAAMDSTLLAISRDKLSAKLERDVAFAAKFYRGIGVFLADRLRTSTRLLGFENLRPRRPEDPADEEIDPALLDSIAIAAKRFELLVERLQNARA